MAAWPLTLSGMMSPAGLILRMVGLAKSRCMRFSWSDDSDAGLHADARLGLRVVETGGVVAVGPLRTALVSGRDAAGTGDDAHAVCSCEDSSATTTGREGVATPPGGAAAMAGERLSGTIRSIRASSAQTAWRSASDS